VRQPQTNGKLERAFRDDLKEFYQRQPEWQLDPLRPALPAYVHSRNYLRGHRALGGKPASTRLPHHQRSAAPHVLRRLEGYARTTRAQRLVSPNGSLTLRGQEVYVRRVWAGGTVGLVDPLQGLEIKHGRRQVAFLPDYRWSGPRPTSRLLTAFPRPLNRGGKHSPRLASFWSIGSS
jgi:hypothetical protein